MRKHYVADGQASVSKIDGYDGQQVAVRDIQDFTDIATVQGHLVACVDRCVTRKSDGATFCRAFVVSSSNNFLARIAALVHAERIEEVKIQHVWRKLLDLTASDIGVAVFDKMGGIDRLASVEDSEFDF